ncbi:Pimeloyl-ACP methyl ester carboxylesterase [Pseudonocardia thermophila]|jgi:Predicted hydrolases or acyltransferases (alpha/beta hydrolase superfamily)|uniref:Pimeloyl-ACP methyl ester carboxylesterase n=1 Tax=Pseudonocardia thermophila TaxID=1848 RepID=A0A1M6NID9_PSETH|nr:alpha/beta hydrolase [Pseudonocardia thermophila]SHJ95433.1 Pimeloyl-ACP methyl ester carboxylesterase [Pseudonocardia thermophila]
MTTTLTAGTVAVDGGHIAYDRAGTGPAAVFLHGGALDRRMWDPQLGFTDRWTVVRIDARGHGDSSTPRAPFRHYADVVAVLEALDLGPAVLVGLSMGGATALDVAITRPDLVRAVVACGAGASSAGAADLFRDPWTLARLGELAHAAATRDAERWTEAFLQVGLVGPYRAVTDVDPAVLAGCRAMIAHTLAAHVVHGGPPPQSLPDAAARAAEIAVPVLAVTGALDSPDHVRMSRELAETVPDGRLAVVERAAHLPNMEEPALFDAQVRRFLEAL